MSDSRKRTPIQGNCSYRAGEMAAFRKRTTKRLRAKTKLAINKQDPEALTDPRSPEAVIDRWAAPDDGKAYVCAPKPEDLRK